MKKIISKAMIICIVLAVVLCATVFPTNIFAKSLDTDSDVDQTRDPIFAKVVTYFTPAASSYTIEKNGKYTVLTLNVENGDSIRSRCQKALDYAKTHATKSNPCMVVIPAGSYLLSGSLSIYSNTYISAKGATMKMIRGGRMIRNGTKEEAAREKWTGYSKFRNITVDGGVWNGNGTSKTGTFSNFRFARVTGLTIKNLSVLNNTGAHHIEFAAVNHVNISNCTFSGWKRGQASTGKEAIQFDFMYSADCFREFGKYDRKTCYNVTIQGCTFKNVSRGLGAHGITSNRYYNNIVIKNNEFKNMSSYAIGGLNFRKCVIKNNVMTNVPAGIFMQSINRNTKMKYYIEDNKIYTKRQKGRSGYGIKFIGIRSATIRRNIISTGGEYGIGLTGNSRVGSIHDNTIYKSSGKAIYVASGSHSPVASILGIRINKINKSKKLFYGTSQAKKTINVSIDDKLYRRAKVSKNKKFIVKYWKRPNKNSTVKLWTTDRYKNVVKISKTI